MQERAIVATTVTPSGQTIDWIRPESQTADGTLAQPPDRPVANARAGTRMPPQFSPPGLAAQVEWRAQTEVQLRPSIRGPQGTVPVVRFDVEKYLASVKVPPENPQDVLRKLPPPVTPAAAISAEPTLAHGVSRTPHPGAMAASSSQEVLAVMYNAGRLSVHAERISLGRILEEVARQTGFEIRGLSSLQQDVSVQFAGLPLLDGLRRLLARVNYLFLIECSPEGNIRRMQALVFGRETTPSFGRFAREAPTPSGEGITSESPRQAMADADPSVRRWVVERLGERGDEQAFTHLLAALDDADPEVRQGALASLSQYGVMTLEPLQALPQREQDHTVRIVAFQVLGQVGRADEETVTLLQGMLTDHDPYIRAAVVEALGSVGGPRVTDALHTAARDGDPEVRLSALRALALHVRDALAQAAVEQHLDDADEAVRGGAAALLEKFTE